MAAKAAARREAAEALRRAEEDRRYEEWRATLPPCPCPFDPCPVPPAEHSYLWQYHLEHWTAWRRTGRCPLCDLPMTPAEAVEHDCPNEVALAAV